VIGNWVKSYKARGGLVSIAKAPNLRSESGNPLYEAGTSWEQQASRRKFAAVESRKRVPKGRPSGTRHKSTCPKRPTLGTAQKHARSANLLLIVSSGGRLGFERFPQPQPPTAVENIAAVRNAFALASTHRLWIRVRGAGNPAVSSSTVKRLDQSVEQRVVPCSQTNTQMSSGIPTRLYYKAFAGTRSCPWINRR
jgi:hypothetical protein